MITPASEISEIVLYVVPQPYSCGGYFVAQEWGDEGEVRIVDGRILSHQRAIQVIENVRRNHARLYGEVPVRVEWVDALPSGSRIIR